MQTKMNSGNGNVKNFEAGSEKVQNCSPYTGAAFMTPDNTGSINQTLTKENDTFSETFEKASCFGV